MRRRDWAGLAAVLLTVAGLESFRLVWFEPRAVGLACLHHVGPPAICAARTLLGWLTHFQVMGASALALGVLALAGTSFAVAVAAVCAGTAGLIDYNISWGMLGAALGVWIWMEGLRPKGPLRAGPPTLAGLGALPPAGSRGSAPGRPT